MLKGKQGRFRQNLLGKRVDYSGRSVIVVGPTLKLHQCGLPKQMALELFKPFVMKRLVDLELAQNIKSAKRMVERRRAQVWDVLEEVIKEHPVFLNRAPTLHRLGHPGLRADAGRGQGHPDPPAGLHRLQRRLRRRPDGRAPAAVGRGPGRGPHPDAVGQQHPVAGHRPPDHRAHPGHGVRRLLPHRSPQDGAAGEGRVFRHLYEVERAYEARRRRPARAGSRSATPSVPVDATEDGHRTTRSRPPPGRLLFNPALPDDFGYVNERHRQARTSSIGVDRRGAGRRTTPRRSWPTASTRSRTSGFRFAAQSGLTISIDDVKTPPEKAQILDRYEKEAEKAETQFKRGIITDDERRQKEDRDLDRRPTPRSSGRWRRPSGQNPFNPLNMMVDSGARGNPQQIRQIAGMKGLVANPQGEMIPRPIKSSFREGLSVLEYFISTHGARKGLADTALRTADSGYLTRRLVDVAQELIIREEDCGTTRGVWVEDVVADDAEPAAYLDTRLYGRVLAERHRARSRPAPSSADDEVDVAPRRPRRHRGPRPLGAHVRGRARRVRPVLRPLARHQPPHRAGRGGRRHRRPVHR